MRKKIAVYLNSEPEWGGQHQYAVVLMECLAKVNDIDILAICNSQYWRSWCRKHQIRVWNIEWPDFTEKAKKYHLACPMFSRIYSVHMTGFGKGLRKEKIDAVICTTQGTFVPNLGIKVIAPVHDLMHRYEGSFPEVSKDYEVREVLLSAKARYTWCILTDSKLGKKQFIESYSKYIKRHTHIVSLPFVTPKHDKESIEEFIETPKKYIFYPAQFWQHKNHMNLVKAVNLLVRDIPDIHLVLVGSEKNCLKKIQQYVQEHELRNHITIKGFVSDGNITYLYKHAVGLIMPSYFGPTNIPPLEAMALGCPVAVSNKYAMPEQVGEAGLLFDPDSPKEIAECIRKIWLDDNLRQEMIRKGYQRIKKWNRETFAEKLQNIIKQI